MPVSLLLSQESSILERIAEQLLVLDADGVICYANRAACERFATTQQQMLQKTACDLLFECDAAQWRQHWLQLDQEPEIHLACKGIVPGSPGCELKLERVRLGDHDYALGFVVSAPALADYCADSQGACLVADTCSTMVAYITGQQIITYINPAFERRFQIGLHDCIGQPLQTVLDEKIYQGMQKQIQKVLAGDAVSFDLTYNNDAHQRQQLKVQLVPYRKASHAAGFYLFIHDASEQLQLQSSLRRQQAEWATAMEALDDAIYLLDLDERLIQANQAFYRLTGLKPEQAVGQDILKIMFPDGESALCPACLNRRVRRDMEQVLEADHPDNPTGRPIMVLVRMVRDAQGSIIGVLKLIRDLTEQRAIETALRNYSDHLGELVAKRTAVLSGIFRSAPIGIGLLKSRVVQEINDYFCSRLGYGREEIIGQNARMFYPDDAEYEYVGREKYRQMAESGTGTVESRLLTKQGKQLDVLLSSTYLDADRPGDGVIFTMLDITKRKQAEHSIRESERKYRMLMTQANDAIFIGDVETGIILEANTAAERLIGLPASELVGMHQSKLHPDDMQEKYIQLFRRHAKFSKSHANTVYVKHADGHSIPVSIRTNTFNADGRLLMQGIFHDLTDIYRAEQKRMQQEKRQRSLLVREVHHRIKNNLQAVVSLLRQHMTDDERINEVFNKAITQVESISLVHGLQATASGSGVNLPGMLRAILETQPGLTDISLTTTIDLDESIELNKDKSVAISLIINELILNAVKHREPDSRVEVKLYRSDAATVCLEISNQGQLPEQFDWQSKSGLGTGLELIYMMVPHQGASLEILQQENRVVSRLLLQPPLLL